MYFETARFNLEPSTRLDLPSDPGTCILGFEVIHSVVLPWRRDIFRCIFCPVLDGACRGFEFLVSVGLRVVAKQPLRERHRKRLRILLHGFKIRLVPDIPRLLADLLC